MEVVRLLGVGSVTSLFLTDRHFTTLSRRGCSPAAVACGWVPTRHMPSPGTWGGFVGYICSTLARVTALASRTVTL